MSSKRDGERKMSRRQMLEGVGAAALASVLSVEALATPDEKRAPANLADMLEPIRVKSDLPALAACVLQEGKVVALGATGIRKYGEDVKVTEADQFHLGSCTKAMTATLCGILVEEGKLAWETPLEKYFPELADTMTPAYRTLTLDHLLAQRTGFSQESAPHGKSLLDMHRLPGKPREQRATYVKLILQDKPVSDPGTQFLYSNRNFAVAGIIAERAADLAWEELITQKLFQPLGMKSAGFGAMGKPGKIEQPWQHRLQNGKPIPIPPGPLSDNPPVIAPAGRVHSSLGDWAKFILLHLRGEQGEKGLLKPETIKRLHTPLYGGDYVGGWVATERNWGGGRVLWHNGSNTMNYALVWMAPLKNFAVLTATNLGGGTEGKICDEVTGALIRQFLKA